MPRRRLVLRALVAAALLAGGLALASCGGSDETETTSTLAPSTTGDMEITNTGTETTETGATETTREEEPVVVDIVVAGGVPANGIVRATVSKGDRVVLVVTSDLADEIHLHGYDLSRDVAAGGTTRLGFVARIPGRFEIELEKRSVQIGDLTVEP